MIFGRASVDHEGDTAAAVEMNSIIHSYSPRECYDGRRPMRALQMRAGRFTPDVDPLPLSDSSTLRVGPHSQHARRYTCYLSQARGILIQGNSTH